MVASLIGAICIGLHLQALIYMSVSILPFLCNALLVYTIYGMGKLMIKMYELSPAIAFFQIILVALSSIIQILIPVPIPDSTPVNDLGIFLLCLTMASLTYTTNKKLENMSERDAEMMEILPMPTEPVSATFQQSSLIGYKKANWSHRLFNTPKDADYVKAEERTYAQQWSCFFGGGAKGSNDVPQFADTEEAHARTLLIA